MTQPYYVCLNRFLAALPQSYVASSGVVVLPTGYGAIISSQLALMSISAISATRPLLFQIVERKAYGVIRTNTKRCQYTATSLVGDTLQGVSPTQGQTDQNFSIGDIVYCPWTALYYESLVQHYLNDRLH